MKKFSLLFTLLLLVSCNNTAVQKVADSITPDAEIVEVEINNPAGYLSTTEGKFNAFDGAQENLEIWDAYIDAHNNRYLDVIREMNADSTKQFGAFKVYDAKGGVVDGPDNHIKRLSPDCISPQRGFNKNKINQSKLSYKIVGKRTLNNSPTLQTK